MLAVRRRSIIFCIAAEIPLGMIRIIINAATSSATVPRNAPNAIPIGVLIADSKTLLPTAPLMTFAAPPTTTVMKAGATNCCHIKGAIVEVGANSAPLKPARPAPRLNVSV